MPNRIICFALIFVMLFSVVAYGESYETRDASSIVKLSFSDGKAICKCTINYTDKTIKATMKLYSGTALAGTWYGEAVGSLTVTGRKVVVSGRTYTLKVTATVDGRPISIPSVTKTAP